jgi:virginiamycin A acetyltransferase
MTISLRRAAKTLAFWLATVVVAPQLALFVVRAAILGRDRALEGSSQALSLWPGVLGQYVRRAFYARVLDHCDPSATIEFGVLFSKSGARLAENVYVGPRCHLGLVDIGRDVLIGPAVHVPSGRATHGTGDVSRPMREQAGTVTRITIGAGSWIGSGAIIMADIGRDTVVGAGSVVTHTLPDHVVAAGVPAVVVRDRVSGPGASSASATVTS